jgi:hypothetical protein
MSQDPVTAPVRVGVFYDGSFLAVLQTYFQHHHPNRTRINLEDFHDAICLYARTVYDRPAAEIEVSEAHHFQGHGTTAIFAPVLDRLKIQRHELPVNRGKSGGGPEGLAVEFALTCYEAAHDAPLDMLVLLTGDPDYIPLVRWLVEDGFEVLVPHIHLMSFNRSGHQQYLATAPRLLEHATHTPGIEELLTMLPSRRGDRR